MSGTRSRSRTAPVTDALIVAHGLPSSPEGQELRMRALAGRVTARLSGTVARGTTLAMPDGLARAVAACRSAPVVYPLFMADGWFVRTELPRRLRLAGAAEAEVLPPFGLDPKLPALALSRLTEAVAEPAGTGVLIAAHGSPKDPRPAAAARALAASLAPAGFREIRCGFIDEAPYLAEAGRGMGRAVCLPFFARRAGHVENDLPEALGEAGFDGPVLPPIGEDPETPSIIAAAIAEAVAGADRADDGATLTFAHRVDR